MSSLETTVNVPLPRFTRGDTYDWTLPFTYGDGSAFDFTPWEGSGKGIQGQMRLGSPDGDSIGTVTWTTNAQDAGIPLGYARVLVSSTDAANATGGYLYYDVEGYDSNVVPTVKTTIVSGRIPILKDVTRL